MKRITYFWNKIFYNIWKFNCSYPLFNYFLKKKRVQDFYRKRGVANIQDTLFEAISYVMLPFSFYTMLLISCMIMLPIGIYVLRILISYKINKIISVISFVVIVALPSSIINEYLLSWWNDGFLVYFKMFEKESEKEKRKWKYITLFTITLLLVISICLFWILL